MRAYKKATTVREEDRRGLLETLRQFATLNAARVQSERRALLFDNSSTVLSGHAGRSSPWLLDGRHRRDSRQGQINREPSTRPSSQVRRRRGTEWLARSRSSSIQKIRRGPRRRRRRRAQGLLCPPRRRVCGPSEMPCVGQLDTISGVLSAQSQGDIGFVKVILRREAWAKSHRPVASPVSRQSHARRGRRRSRRDDRRSPAQRGCGRLRPRSQGPRPTPRCGSTSRSRRMSHIRPRERARPAAMTVSNSMDRPTVAAFRRGSSSVAFQPDDRQRLSRSNC